VILWSQKSDAGEVHVPQFYLRTSQCMQFSTTEDCLLTLTGGLSSFMIRNIAPNIYSNGVPAKFLRETSPPRDCTGRIIAQS